MKNKHRLDIIEVEIENLAARITQLEDVADRPGEVIEDLDDE